MTVVEAVAAGRPDGHYLFNFGPWLLYLGIVLVRLSCGYWSNCFIFPFHEAGEVEKPESWSSIWASKMQLIQH